MSAGPGRKAGRADSEIELVGWLVNQDKLLKLFHGRHQSRVNMLCMYLTHLSVVLVQTQTHTHTHTRHKQDNTDSCIQYMY